MSVTRKEMIKAAKEMNKIMGLKPQIETDADDETLRKLLMEAVDCINPEDEFSKNVEDIIQKLMEEKDEEEEEEDEEEEDEEEEDEEEEEEDEEEEDEEEDEEEPEEEKKVKAPTSTKPEKEEKTKKEKTVKKPPQYANAKITRVVATIEAFRRMSGKTESEKDVITLADDIYVKNGGKSNPKEAKFTYKIVAGAVECLNLITIEEGSVSVHNNFPAQ